MYESLALYPMPQWHGAYGRSIILLIIHEIVVNYDDDGGGGVTKNICI